MKSISLLIISFLLALSLPSFSQTATNFTTLDCDGNTHSLFDELDAGKVIVLTWVMPCGACSYFGFPAYNAAESFSISNPDQVLFYLIDDYANSTCQSITDWGILNNMQNHTAFSSADISMSDYGTNGMPKVVVVAGSNHAVLYNKNDTNIEYEDVVTAISNGLNSVAIDEQQKKQINISAYPNPNTGTLAVSFFLNDNGESKLELFSVLGEMIEEFDLNDCLVGQNNEILLDLSMYVNGTYIFKLSSESGIQTLSINLNK
jgi:hypothetical protein